MTSKEQVYEQALRDILDPIAAMTRDLPEGYKLDGIAAVRSSDNPQTYKDIARKALESGAAHEPLIEPAAEQSAANSGQRVSREAAQSGTTAGSSLPPRTDEARLLAHLSADEFATCLTGILVSTQMPESIRIYVNEARNRLRATQPPGALRPGLEQAITIISAIEAPSEYYEPFKTRLVDALQEAVYSTAAKAPEQISEPPAVVAGGHVCTKNILCGLQHGHTEPCDKSFNVPF